ncbi:cytochrome c-type biogenesis protein CcmH [Microbulbifer agarilyticus]|uniref:cytochrome c-type biogenesis protein n=1 Tax=Microbulbifer agarilyticus TaxID=260552 RepID=UPI001C9663C8|nr:cytochrome c-type biogenesis protein [Microbulbifer agarilyticus]MBY6189047.1 cytochrome c-type biogenesis protein CcmH [Microbulbifer agarilyticus]MBY6212115.1 cytochrome c-type biogenesis protein CcmH [Microbulbifer agarilyticus]
MQKKRINASLTKKIAATLTLLATMVAFLPSSYAAVEVERLPSAELQARYEVLIEELRCPKCQNQNLAGSDSMVATDLRREVRRLLEEGYTDEEINQYMVARYGDFVLYRPPMQRNTMVLWVAPGVFAALGLLSLILIVVRSRNGRGGRQEEEGAELSAEESQRLAELLNGEQQGGSKRND